MLYNVVDKTNGIMIISVAVPDDFVGSESDS